MLAALAAAGLGFSYPTGVGWSEELIDCAGIAIAVLGVLLSGLARARARISGRGYRWSSPGPWAVAGGLALILGQVAASIALMAVFGVQLIRKLRRAQATRQDAAPLVWPSLRDTMLAEGPLLLGVCALCLLLEMWEHAAAPGGYKVHALELAAIGSLLALISVALASSTANFHSGRDGAGPRPLEARTAFTGGALCLLGFGALTAIIGRQEVQSADQWLIHSFYKSGGREITEFMRDVSSSGGRDLAIYWIPAILLGLCLARRRHAVAYFAASMVGTLGLETLFKTLVQRPRPDFTRGVHLDSFPSGHALAATILAGTLLLIWLPACNRRRQKAVIWLAAVCWPLVMAASRVYLGRHYVTDVAAGILLGAAWVQLCYGLVLTLQAAYASRTTEPSLAIAD